MKENLQLREDLSETLCELAEAIIRRDAPFENFPMEKEDYDYRYRKYIQYQGEMDEKLRTEYFQGCIDAAKYRIRDRFKVGNRENFPTQFPQHKEIDAAVKKWILEKEGPPEPYVPPRGPKKEPNYDLSKTVKEAIKEKKPWWTHQKKLSSTGFLVFAKPGKQRKICFGVDRGRIQRNSLSFSIGFDVPEMQMVFNLDTFTEGERRYNHFTAEEMKRHIHRLLALFDAIEPYFWERVEKVLNQHC